MFYAIKNAPVKVIKASAQPKLTPFLAVRAKIETSEERWQKIESTWQITYTLINICTFLKRILHGNIFYGVTTWFKI